MAIDLIINNQSIKTKNIYNLASGKTINILEIAHLVKNIYRKKYDKDIDIFFSDNSISGDATKFSNRETFHIDVKRMEKLGFKTKTSLQKGIADFFEWLDTYW